MKTCIIQHNKRVFWNLKKKLLFEPKSWTFQELSVKPCINCRSIIRHNILTSPSYDPLFYSSSLTVLHETRRIHFSMNFYAWSVNIINNMIFFSVSIFSQNGFFFLPRLFLQKKVFTCYSKKFHSCNRLMLHRKEDSSFLSRVVEWCSMTCSRSASVMNFLCNVSCPLFYPPFLCIFYPSV